MLPKQDLVGVLRARAATTPDRVALTWLPDLGAAADGLTWADLDDGAAATAACLLDQGVPPGDRVLLVQPPGLGFVRGFLGCLYAGCVPVPVYPVAEHREGVRILRAVAQDSGARAAWVPDAEYGALVEDAVGVPTIWRTGARRHLPVHPPEPDAVAFLQYTSGSTDAPKGVLVTHGNLRRNLESIRRAFGHTPNDVVLSWLPMYHDMGLIGNLLHPLSLGCPVYLASPASFIRRPLRWLEAISRYGVTTSGAPAFAYDMVNRAVAASGPPPVDLSRWRRAYCGAEPIPAGTLERFAELLAGTGFAESALMPCYGLAEATLLVTCMPLDAGVATGRSTEDSRPAVSCGVAQGCSVAIADPQGRPVPDGAVGEVFVQGDSVAGGYWNRPELSERTFQVTLDGRAGTWLRTGDLGFLQDELSSPAAENPGPKQHLYITGRVKDVVIVRGRNHQPQDIERVIAEAVPEIRPGGVIAFGDELGRGVVVVAEMRRPDVSSREATTRALSSSFGLALIDFVAVPPGAIPKTTSGKLRRPECQRRYLAGSLRDPAPEPGVAVVEPDAIAKDAARLLGFPVPVDKPLIDLGVDSLTALRLAELVLQRTGVDVPVRALLDGASLADVLGSREPKTPAAEPSAEGTLSAGQQALVFLNMLAPDDDSYVISFAWQLGPGSDRQRFEQAFRAAALNQPELGTRVVTDARGMRRANLGPDRLRAALALTPVPLPEERLAEQLELAAATPFRLAADEPLIRTYAWSTGDRTTYQLVVHHLVTDLWSLCLLWRDVATAYVDLAAGREPRLPEILPYDVYIAAQRQYLTSPPAVERDDRLRELLPTRSAAHGVRTDRPKPPTRDPRGGRTTRLVPTNVLAGYTGTDLVALVGAAWAVTLHRFGTPNPVMIGLPVAGRPNARLAGVGGLCTNTAPLALRIDPDAPLADLLAQARTQVLEAADTGLYPLARAVQAVQPDREIGRAPLVEVTLNVHENPLPEVAGLPAALTGSAVDLDFGGLRVRTVPVRRSSIRYDLELFVTLVADGGELALEYSAELFDPGSADSVLASFEASLRVAAAAHGAGRVGDLFVLSAADREVLAVGERGGAEPTEPGALDHLRRVVERSPDAPAIEEAGRTMTYAEFQAAVDRLAAGIRTGAGSTVGVFVETTTEFTVGMFASWAAGRGIIPLPREFPDDRLRAMLADAGPGLLLISADRERRATELVRDLPGSIAVAVLWDLEGEPLPATPPGQDDPAYVVYTSGSTGRSKGVLISHRNLAPLIGWTQSGLGVGPSTRMAQTLSLAFDFGLQELFSTLPFGGCLVVPSAGDRADARSYARFLRRARVTALFTTPSFADQLVAAAEPMPDLSLIQLGGEVLSATTVDGLRRLAMPDCRIFNGYGPTETAVGCAVYEVPPAPVERAAPAVLPVGHAHADAHLVVVDPYGFRAPVGAVGELLIGGPGVSEGYLGQPEQTAERFVTDPTGDVGGRVYRSGDVAYVRQDGNLVVTGRTDRQLKIRGYRVELGDVEHVLRGVPGVAAAVALMVDEPRRLVAAVAGTDLDPEALRAAAARLLLPAAVPEQFVLLDTLPTGTTGKLDPTAVAELAQHRYLPPLPAGPSHGMVEEAVCAVWARALAVPELESSANVFDLGAHSLVVTRVHAQLEAMLGIRFPIHQVFEFPAPEDLARCLVGYLPPVWEKPSESRKDR
jgi:nonribosomal peptide synthetase protein BlmVI